MEATEFSVIACIVVESERSRDKRGRWITIYENYVSEVRILEQLYGEMLQINGNLLALLTLTDARPTVLLHNHNTLKVHSDWLWRAAQSIVFKILMCLHMYNT